jgi:uncharacterized protein involved in outer membrane biogenesis
VNRWRLAGLSAAVAMALLAAALVIAEHHLQQLVPRLLSARMGREVRVEGTLEAHLLSTRPEITATNVVIANPPWMPAGMLASIGRVSLTLRWRVAASPLEIRRVELARMRLRLVRDASDHANWYATRAGPGTGPPLIGSLSMSDAKVELHDERRHMEFNGTVSAGDAVSGGDAVSAADAVGAHGDAPPLRIEGSGLLNGRRASFRIDADPLASTRPGKPYHFTLEERSGAARLTGHGFLKHALDFRELEGAFEVSGPDLIDLYYLTGLKLVRTGEFHLSGKLLREDTRRFIYKDLAGATGKSDVNGTLSVDSTSGRIRVSGELSARLLRVADFGDRAGADTSAAAPKSALRIPDTPLRLTGLRDTEAKVTVRAQTLELGRETLQSAAAAITTDRGKVSLENLRASLAQGTVTGSARLDATGEIPRGALDLSVADVHPEELESGAGKDAPFAGALSGRAQLDAQGGSWHELAAAANGTVTLVIPHGAMRATLANAAGLDLSAVLGMVHKSQEDTGVRCAVASFDAHQGVFSVRTLVVDTDRVLITGSGTIHMDSESLDLRLHGRPKRPEIALHEDIAVRGTLAHPEVRLSGHGALAQTGAAVALGVVLTPLASVLAFVNPGLAHNADCAGLLAQAKTATGTP